MNVCSTETEALLFQIEELFERFRNLAQSDRVLILEKIRIKLLEEFKDFVIEENECVPADVIVGVHLPKTEELIDISKNYVEFSNQEEEYVESVIISTREDTSVPESLVKTEPCQVGSQKEKPKSERKPNNLCLMCNYCGKQFRRKALFDGHLKRHKNERSYQCSTCLQNFNVKDDLNRHLKTHTGVKNFVCHICQKQLVNSTTLRNHIRVMHKKDEKFYCSKCDYYAFSKRTLNEHIRIKHEKMFTKYACVICENVFNSRVLLKVHLRSHTGEKPYSCKECDASFVCSGRLTNHMNSVHGERKYPCKICDKSFKTIHKLKRHTFVHTRVKPFTCPFCTNYASNTQGNLTKHVKSVHQMNDFSYLKYKRMMQNEIEEVKDEWLKNAETFTKDYLKKLSSNGEVISIDKLKEKHMRLKKKATKPQTRRSNNSDNATNSCS